MANINLNIAGKDINIQISESNSDWLFVKDEKYRPDRGEFILDRFLIDYPNIDVKRDINLVYSLCSRSSSLGEWLALQNLDYALIQDEPTYYRDVVSADKYELISAELKSISLRQSNRAKEESEAASRYKERISEIAKKYSTAPIKIKEARVISMNSTELPLTLQLAIENFTPAANDNPNRRAFARELLINYKLALLKIIRVDPDVDIDEVIKDGYVK